MCTHYSVLFTGRNEANFHSCVFVIRLKLFLQVQVITVVMKVIFCGKMMFWETNGFGGNDVFVGRSIRGAAIISVGWIETLRKKYFCGGKQYARKSIFVRPINIYVQQVYTFICTGEDPAYIIHRIFYINMEADEMIYRNINLFERIWMLKTPSCLKGLTKRLCEISASAYL